MWPSDYGFYASEYEDTPGAGVETNIDLAHDAARLSLGGNWRMPSRVELQELINNTSHEWITKNGVQGMIFRSNVNSQSIFIPSTGFVRDGAFLSGGVSTRLWSSTFSSAEEANGLSLSGVGISFSSAIARYMGYCVRAVRDD